MKKFNKIITVLVLLILTVSLTAENKGNFLWKVSGTKAKVVVYLLGSIHIVPDDVYPLSNKIEDAYEKSDYLVVEADINNIDQSKVQQLTMAKGMYTDGNTLKKVLSEDLYDKLEEALKSVGGMLTIDAIQMMKPWLVAITLPQLKIMTDGLKADNGIDMHFLKKASAEKKKILELESAEFQFELLSGFSDELQIKFLESSVKEIDTIKEKFDSMVQAWKDDNVAKMTEIVNKEYTSSPELKPVYDKLIVDRNVTMTDKIVGYLENKSSDRYFVVVGAGHLIDKDGIVAMLKKKGYAVEKL